MKSRKRSYESWAESRGESNEPSDESFGESPRESHEIHWRNLSPESSHLWSRGESNESHRESRGANDKVTHLVRLSTRHASHPVSRVTEIGHTTPNMSPTSRIAAANLSLAWNRPPALERGGTPLSQCQILKVALPRDQCATWAIWGFHRWGKKTTGRQSLNGKIVT